VASVIACRRKNDFLYDDFRPVSLPLYHFQQPMKNIRLFWQIFLATMLIITGSILAGSWYGSSMVRSFYYQQMQEDIGNRALLLRPHILQLLNEDTRQLRIFCRRAGRAASTRITVIDGNGTVLADSNEDPARMDNHGGRPEIRIAMQGETGSSLRFSKTLSKTMLYVAIPMADQPKQGVLRLSVPATAMDAVLSSIRIKIFVGTLAIILLAAWLSYILARCISRPLEKMRQGAARLAAGESDHSIILEDDNVAREIAELAVAFNTMGEQINGRINMISQQRNELEAVFSSMTDGVLAIGSNHKIIRINRATVNLFHIDGQAVQKKTYEGVIRNRELQQFLSNCLKQESIKTKDISLQENGRNLSLRIHAVPLFDGESRRMGSLIILNNLTMLHELEHAARILSPMCHMN
jgi:two-component system phosphate regulon sensor histidine kinase PhoR